jgi:acyl-CoA synthetase (AMP-forming)/AMP-acid ligase II
VPTIPSEIVRNALRAPERDALVFGARRTTWAEYARRTEAYATVLRDLGVTRGDRCALMAANSDEFILAAHAVLRAGGILVPINPRLAAPEVAYVIRDSGSRLLLFDAALQALVDELPGRDLGAEPPLRLPLGDSRDGDDLAGRGAHAHAGRLDVPVAPDDDAIILYTSGTTGFPKGVLHDHHRLFWAGLAQLPTCGLREAERYLHVAPLYHGAGVTLTTAMTIVAGTNVVLPGFDPATVLETIERERITAMLGVPTMFQFLLRHPDLGSRDLSSWRVGIFGAAPMPEVAVRAMLDALPNVAMVQQCGQTEAGPAGIYQTPEQVIARPDVSGFQPMPFFEARAVDAEDRDIDPGDTGELILRGESVMKGYWGQPEATAAALRDGWLRTGDIVRLDPDGALTVVDRLKDVIITGGRNVYSVEVENALAADPRLRDCAVVGRPHPDWGESIVAVVDPAGEERVTLEGIRAEARLRIADYKLPHEVIVAPIPRNASGKILKHVLRELVAARATAAP